MRRRIWSLLLVFAVLVAWIPTGALAAGTENLGNDYPNTYVNTGFQASDIVGVAKTQLGYVEPTDDHTKYSRWFYGDDTEMAWCSLFISWCADQAEIPDSVIRKTARARGYTTADMADNDFGVTSTYAFGSTAPQTGDILFTITQQGVTTSCHTALVESVDSNYIYTIEGNTTVNGAGTVYERRYSRSTGYQVYNQTVNGTTQVVSSSYVHILFFVRPAYDTPKNGWCQKDGNWYYYIENVSQKGWKKLDGKWYYLNTGSGVMETGWVTWNGKWYWLSSNGDMLTGRWLSWKGGWYYLSDSGAMKTGWLQWNGSWYYFSGSGAMKTGWLQWNGSWYYFDASGAMRTSRWLQWDGNWYWFDQNGAMVTGTSVEYDGITYEFDDSGICTNP